MRQALLVFFLLGSSCWPARLGAQGQSLTTSGLPEFLTRYETSLEPIDAAYAALAEENLPLRDESGQALGRRPIDNRRQAIADLRQTVRQLAASPQDLVLTTKLFFQTEATADDLFDLSQIAYDNDREELGKRLSDLTAIMDHHNNLIESYALSLAAEKQERIRELEKENRELQQKLKAVREQRKVKSSRRP